MLVSLLDLRTEIRSRGNLENSQAITNIELDSWINRSLTKLYGMLIGARTEMYFKKTYSFPLVSGVNKYPMPTDFGDTLLGVDYVLNGSQRFSLTRYNFKQRNKFNNLVGYNFANMNLQYNLEGDYIEFIPLINQLGTIEIFYVPVCPKLTADGDTFNFRNGYEEYIILDVLMKAKEKLEEAVDSTAALLMKEEDRVRRESAERDEGEPLNLDAQSMAVRRGRGWY